MQIRINRQIVKWVFPVMCLALLSCSSATPHRDPIDHMIIYSLGWDDRFGVSMSPRRVMESGQTKVKDIDDSKFMQGVEEHISKIEKQTSRDESPIDGRLVSLLHRTRGYTDTLVFSRLKMEYNGRTYDVDTTLLRLVGSTQPTYYQESIGHSIDVLKMNHIVNE